MSTATVTITTNRIDLFAREHLGGATDANIRNLISWNADYFAGRRTFWLGVGDVLNVGRPVPIPRYYLLVGDGWLAANGKRLLITPEQ